MSDETQAEGQAPADEAVPVVAEPETSVEATSGDDAPAATDDAEAPAPKPKKSFQERIDDLTRDKHEMRREAEYWKAKALQPEARQEQAPEPQGDGKPDPSQYAEGAYDPAFIEDLTDWKAAQAVERTLAKRTEAQTAQAADQAWKERQAEAAKQHPDYEDLVIQGAERGDWVCTPEMAAVIKESERGAQIAYQLAKEPAEARRIAGLSPLAQARELGRLEAKLEQPKPTPAKTVTSAPEPGPSVRGAGGRFTVAPDTSDFAAFEAQYKL